MKKLVFILVLAGFVISDVYAQPSRFYCSGGAEIIFSYANIVNQGNDEGSSIRFAPVLNLQGFANFNPSNTVGFFTGLGIRNVGFIYDPPEGNMTMKYRTYNLGIPLGMKIGKLDYMFIFAGYEIEFPFVYKEKKFQNDTKDVFVEWFSDRVVPVQHTLIAGIQFPYGIDLKLKYYLTNFHNKDYVLVNEGVESLPYQNLYSNIFSISLGWNLLTNFKSYKSRDYFGKSSTMEEESLVLTKQ